MRLTGTLKDIPCHSCSQASSNFSSVSAIVKDVSCSTHYHAPSAPRGFSCPPEASLHAPGPSLQASRTLAKAFFAAAYKHPNLPGLLLSPSSTQHNCEQTNKPTAHTDQILPLAGLVPELVQCVCLHLQKEQQWKEPAWIK